MCHTCDGFGAGEGAEGVRDGVDILWVDVQVHQKAGLQGGAWGRALCPDLTAQCPSKQIAGRRDAALQRRTIRAERCPYVERQVLWLRQDSKYADHTFPQADYHLWAVQAVTHSCMATLVPHDLCAFHLPSELDLHSRRTGRT